MEKLSKVQTASRRAARSRKTGRFAAPQRAMQLHAAKLRELAAKLVRQQATPQDVEAALTELRATLASSPTLASDLKKVQYELLLKRLRSFSAKHIPRDAIVLVVGKGDPKLLKAAGRTAWHFPRNPDGEYTGYHPASSLAAIAQIEVARVQGASHLLLPEPSLWWLEHYAGLSNYLEHQGWLVAHDAEIGTIFALGKPPTAKNTSIARQINQLFAEFQIRYGCEPNLLDWNTGRQLAKLFPRYTVFTPPQARPSLPYLDRTIDLVAVKGGGQVMLAEAQRVARFAVAEMNGHSLVTHWQPGSEVPNLPSASLIVGAHGMTPKRLTMLAESLPKGFSGEVLLWSGSKSDSNALAASACARFAKLKHGGAEQATGDVLIFLESEVLPIAGWFRALLQTFCDHPDAGVAGARLLFADGRLKESGGDLDGQGNPISFGEGEFKAEAPRFNHVRAVDFCSGALLAVRREVFNTFHGFPVKRENHRTDVALCGQARAKGFKVFYQPDCNAVCLGGGQ
jgi:hypothetical protein